MATSRKVHVRVVAQLDRAGPPRRGTLTIDRELGLAVVRPYRSTRTYPMPLDVVAQIIVARNIEAALRERRRLRTERRRRG